MKRYQTFGAVDVQVVGPSKFAPSVVPVTVSSRAVSVSGEAAPRSSFGGPQRPDEQTCPVAQAAPQAPQLAVEVWRLTHAVPQQDWPVGQLQVQAPPAHDREAPQVTPHIPQLALSLCRFTQRPPHTEIGRAHV